ncbi:FimB/Mfa2 family fimbrial subunit [Porphyromonas levii]|uniref:Fimbrial protein n=1 Tax=Porphyromonas levii TaxID=28114 RepID=A0A4Y8WMR9_9PORP|nr:FimB/Mfa2 family fimbrial subunit [Porphyromonas levii]TFH94304.1 fimbrial protein [Porphyromonas levii]TFH97541.1 fimbrial protein [Porphyromonas levii]
MKVFNKLSIIFLGVIIVVFASLSCGKWIYDDMSECPRGVYINVYTQTECANTPEYPAVGRLHVFAFNENNLFVSSELFEGVTLSKDFECLIPIKEPGLYSFVVWGGVDDKLFKLETLTPAKSTKDELLLALNRHDGIATNLAKKQVYVGETPAVRLELETNHFVHTKANVRELTNRINVLVEDVDDAEKFEIELLSANTDYSVKGDIIKNSVVEYPTEVKYPGEKTLTADFTTMKLESGRQNILVVKEKATGKEIFREDLVGVILLSPSEANINLRCDNDFKVKLKTRRCNCPGGFMVTELWINDWMVHSYDIVLGS